VGFPDDDVLLNRGLAGVEGTDVEVGAKWELERALRTKRTATP
jgi:hypothetical protein